MWRGDQVAGDESDSDDARGEAFLKLVTVNRREVMKTGLAVSALTASGFELPSSLANAAESARPALMTATLIVNGQRQRVEVDPRTSLLDLLRERLSLTGTKKGCDHGQCGACTVHIDGRRVLSCLTPALQADGRRVTTIEGLTNEGELHPMQRAFVEHDALQCGYCTPGQIMAAVACVEEGHATSQDQICEYMSGNLCRCGAYRGIVAAIQDVARKMREV